ncbi:MAG: pyruvate kinase [Planctomycetota bacterium]|jgi:pyruvate kinase
MAQSSYIPFSLTKIIATVGPSCDSAEMLRHLIEAGVSVFRLNFSHGTEAEHDVRLKLIREVSADIARHVSVMGDLPGPKIRVGIVPGDGIEVRQGDEIAFRCGIEEAIPGEIPIFPCTYEKLIDEVEPGHRVLIADGAVRALAVERMESESSGGELELRCRITTGGVIGSKKGVNLPDSDISVPAITEVDWKWARWAYDHGIDYLALSFVRRADEVRRLKETLAEWSEKITRGMEREPHIPVIAKIEKPQAVENIESIVREADGLMVARGDLGVEMDLALVPATQKKLIAAAKSHGCPVIVATQMFESMISSPIPTRAEANDVANAIYDDADAVMLSGETAVGSYPSLAVETMRRIALATESDQRSHASGDAPIPQPNAKNEVLSAMSSGAWHIARGVNAGLVACWSQSGGVARYLSRSGFRIPIIAFTSDVNAARRMSLLYGVVPMLESHPPKHRSEFAGRIEKMLLDKGWAHRGDMYVALAGKPMGKPGVVNTVAIRRVGEIEGTLDGESVEHDRLVEA